MNYLVLHQSTKSFAEAKSSASLVGFAELTDIVRKILAFAEMRDFTFVMQIVVQQLHRLLVTERIAPS